MKRKTTENSKEVNVEENEPYHNDQDDNDDDDDTEDFSSDIHFKTKYSLSEKESVSLQKDYLLHLDCHSQINTSKVLVGLSSNEVVLYDLSNLGLKRILKNNAHTTSITGVKFSSSDESLFYTSSLDGTIKLWDSRVSDGKTSMIFKDDTDGENKLKPINCFDIDSENKFLCAGTPVTEADAYLLFWDIRKSNVLGGYWETHTDDITQIKYAPFDNKILLSASTDGLINVYDVSKKTEEDALECSLNVDISVRTIVWLNVESENVIGCITDMETVQIWKIDDVSPYANYDREFLANNMFIKSSDNAYVTDIHQGNNEILILGGSNANKGEYLKSLMMSDEKLEPCATFIGNESIVRCSYYDKKSKLYITGGESGTLEVWNVSEINKNVGDSIAPTKRRRRIMQSHTEFSQLYPRSNIKRTVIPNCKIDWKDVWLEYQPCDYTSIEVQNKCWADPCIDDPDFQPQWNTIDSGVDRRSFLGNYNIVNNRPLNIIGRTGLQGRGLLGRWGPNKAADPIVTRWKTENNKTIHDSKTNKPILQFIAIQRRDNGQWALPGGMVDLNESVNKTLKREFLEETMNIFENHENVKENVMTSKVDEFFKNGIEIYKGYSYDMRNTDNAWIETTAVHYHDENNKSVSSFPLKAGDDARNVQWMDINKSIELYANHYYYIKKVVNNLNAHW